MKMPTKNERHQIYKDALEIINETSGLCSALKWAESNLNTWSPYDNLKKYFPEVYKHKPLDAGSSFYWFPRSDKQSRIEILKQAINETL